MASCTTTIVIVRTSAASDTIDAAIVDRIATEASEPPVIPFGINEKSDALSIQIVPKESSAPAPTHSAGMNHRLDVTRRTMRPNRTSPVLPLRSKDQSDLRSYAAA